jgi:hypothetical protein
MRKILWVFAYIPRSKFTSSWSKTSRVTNAS